MNCYNPFCNKEIKEGQVVYVPNIIAMNHITLQTKKIGAFAVVCAECVKKYNGEKYVRGEAKVLDTV